jgi:signal transduction histidine kinase
MQQLMLMLSLLKFFFIQRLGWNTLEQLSLVFIVQVVNRVKVEGLHDPFVMVALTHVISWYEIFNIWLSYGGKFWLA